MAVQPFKIEITDSVLDDLNSRLARNLDYVKELVEYWRTKFDWRAQENLINSYSHFKTSKTSTQSTLESKG